MNQHPVWYLMNEQLSTLRRQQDCQDKSSEHGHRMCKASKEQTTRETNHKMTTLEGASTQEMQCNLYEMTTRETNHKMNQHPAWYQSPAWAPSIFGDCPFGRRVVARSLADFERKGVDTEAGILSGISRKRSVLSSARVHGILQVTMLITLRCALHRRWNHQSRIADGMRR